MSFIVDKQTLNDLNVLGKHRYQSIFQLFCQVKTKGGEKLMDEFFQKPLSEVQAINRRSGMFKYFTDKQFLFPFDEKQLNAVEQYLSQRPEGNLWRSGYTVLRKKILDISLRDRHFKTLKQGFLSTTKMLKVFDVFFKNLEKNGFSGADQQTVADVKRLFADKRILGLFQEENMDRMPLRKMINYDYLLRSVLKGDLKKICDTIYHLDVYIAVGNVARKKKFSYADALPKENIVFYAEDLRHPCLGKAVGNTVEFNSQTNVMFLTGANMAGKSTLMKSFGIAVYLAHMGFPIAASSMRFSVKEGLFSSINVPDNLSHGYSHFYAEVLRVKHVAEQVASDKQLFVIFDELFKGTNVKDAYDATLEVTDAFAQYKNCFFIVSTHIIEVGEALRKRCDNVKYTYMPTVMKGLVPQYTYTMKNGISSDRQGMIIIENEGILDIIDS